MLHDFCYREADKKKQDSQFGYIDGKCDPGFDLLSHVSASSMWEIILREFCSCCRQVGQSKRYVKNISRYVTMQRTV